MLASLSAQSDHDTILVRVTRIWEAINKRSGAPIHTNIILLDEKNDHILALVRNNQKAMILPQLKENEVYSITNFKVVPGPTQYKTANNAHAINFYYKIKIEKQADNETIPRYRFELKHFDVVSHLVGNLELLIDVVGRVSSYGRNDRMVVTLWEERADQFMELLSKTKPGPIFVVITGLLAKKNSAWSNTSDAEQAPHAPKEEDFVTTDGSTIMELPVNSILDAKIPPGTDVIRFTCRARIVEILNGNGWYYNCCSKCARAIKNVDGRYNCTGCAEDPGNSEQRFRLVVRVEDITATTTLTLFNKEAEQIVGVPLKKILEEQAQDAPLTVVPATVNNIIGKSYVFQLKVTQYNMTHGCEEYTVTRVSETATVESDGGHLTASTSSKENLPGAPTKKPKLA
ncbi:hypothetical protein POM88_005969 [Heracleum sosnowskyi]|uniref:Replication factor A C-terminal domain-containing protein n=1 Tax=Heracleum sosnowskyi TaxID=360622 RepID=A0AAD8N4X3_9APIA|nr:hypothetical protein POM88_005969 [Heracleum sosnowskyi]